MVDSESSNWQKRIAWAKCREPYKTTLDTLASHWIDGVLSHADLALELWKLHHKCREKIQMESEVKPGRSKFNLADVETDLGCLAEAMCMASDDHSAHALENRKAVLAACIEVDRDDPDYSLKR